MEVDFIKFSKYVASGNDFIAFDGISNPIDNMGELALKVCNRQHGIGADGILVCQESETSHIKMIYYNSDGTEGEMCGNGIRSFSKFVYDNKIVKKESFTVETLAGEKNIALEIKDDQVLNIKVDMGIPQFHSDKIPINMSKNRVIEEKILIDNKEFIFSALLVGVPHVVIFIDNIEDIQINDLGEKIENHSLFPRKTNVNFVKINNRKSINIYTWERGAGRTLGCGTGSCASVVIGKLLNRLDERVSVNTEGGNLLVELDSDLKINMSGEAKLVASGKYYVK